MENSTGEVIKKWVIRSVGVTVVILTGTFVLDIIHQSNVTSLAKESLADDGASVYVKKYICGPGTNDEGSGTKEVVVYYDTAEKIPIGRATFFREFSGNECSPGYVIEYHIPRGRTIRDIYLHTEHTVSIEWNYDSFIHRPLSKELDLVGSLSNDTPENMVRIKMLTGGWVQIGVLLKE